MRYVSPGLRQHMEGTWLTMCLCFRITRKDGTTYYYAGHDNDLTIDGNLYVSTTPFTATQADTKSGLSIDNSQLILPYHEAGITKGDVLVGLFFNAKLDVFWVNWDDPSLGKLYEAKNWLLGRALLKEYHTVFEVRSLASYLDVVISDVVAPGCPYIFGLNDGYRSKCPANLDDYKASGTVDSVGNNTRKEFTGSVQGSTYNHGKITFTSGDNDGYSMEIEGATTSISLLIAMPYEIQAGDSYDIWQGCDKTFAACQAYGFYADFGGEPNVPSRDTALQYKGPT